MGLIGRVLPGVLVSACLALAGCGSDSSDDPGAATPLAGEPSGLRPDLASRSAEPSGDAQNGAAPGSDGGPGDGDGGVGASEAASMDALFAEFDARLLAPRYLPADGTATLELENVGSQGDTYEVVLEPGDSGTLEPRRVSLLPGEIATLELRTHLDEVAVHVTSLGREGAGVADAHLARKGAGR